MEIPSIHPDKDHHSGLLQPSGCISRLESTALWFSKRQDKEIPDPLKAELILFAADHGVASAINPACTAATFARVKQSASEDSAITALCRDADCEVHYVDVGVASNLAELDMVEHAKVRSLGPGDIRHESAMSQSDYWEIVGIGEEMANRAINNGANLLITSSISSGDRIAIAAIIAELTGLSPDAALATAPDADAKSYADELMAVEAALTRAQGTPSHDLLRELGGLEMAAMAGLYRAAAQRGVPVLLDGLSSATAALAAIAWDVRIAGWMLASHASKDSGFTEVLEDLGLDPLVELNRSMGEGKVAALMVPVLQAAITLQHGLATIEAK